MSEEADMEFVFVVGRHKDGRVTVGNLEGHKAGREATIDDVYASANIIQRDIQTQQTVAAFMQTMHSSPPPSEPTESVSGVVLPEPTSRFKKVVRSG